MNSLLLSNNDYYYPRNSFAIIDFPSPFHEP